MSKYKIKDLPLNERPRERLKREGSNVLSDRELLTIIIGTGSKNNNAEEVAINILKNYSLSNLKDITIEELIKIDGIGEVKAIKLLSIIELSKRISYEKPKVKQRLTEAKIIYKETKYLFNNLKQEHFYALYLNNKQELIKYKLLFIGSISQASVHPREIFKEAYKLSASSIIVMHNHPSNDVEPSLADIDITNKLINIGQINGIPILDHIIVGDSNYYSFYEKKRNFG